MPLLHFQDFSQVKGTLEADWAQNAERLDTGQISVICRNCLPACTLSHLFFKTVGITVQQRPLTMLLL